ncbi:MAG: hypothetical protein ACM3SM_10830 [Bacteroidota bacterium]
MENSDRKKFELVSARNLLLIIALILSELVYLWFYAGTPSRIERYFWISVITSVMYLIIVILLRRDTGLQSRYLFYVLLFFGILYRITLLPVPPTASDDIYRYIWDGKVQLNGISPYRYAPSDSHLNHLHSDMLPAKMNYKNMKSIYPPVAQYVFRLNYILFGESIYGFKIIMFFFDMLLIASLVLLLKSLGRPISHAAYYFLAPLPAMQFMADGHLDIIGISLLMLSLSLLFRSKQLSSNTPAKIAGYIVLGLSVASKLISGMIFPFLIDKRKIIRSSILLLLPTAAFALTYIPYIEPGVNPFESLKNFASNWAFNGSVFYILVKILQNNQYARLVCMLLFMVVTVVLFLRSNMNTLDKTVIIFFIFLLLSPTVHPWYVCWFAALFPLYFSYSGLTFICTANLANHVVIDYQLRGTWHQNEWLLLLEYLPVYAVMAIEMWRNKTKNPG